MTTCLLHLVGLRLRVYYILSILRGGGTSPPSQYAPVKTQIKTVCDLTPVSMSQSPMLIYLFIKCINIVLHTHYFIGIRITYFLVKESSVSISHSEYYQNVSIVCFRQL